MTKKESHLICLPINWFGVRVNLFTDVFPPPSRWRCISPTMALTRSLLLASLFAFLVVSHTSDPAVTHGKRKQAQTSAGGSNGLQHPLQSLQIPSYSRERRGHGGQGGRGAKGGAGLLAHRPLHPLTRPEDDGMGLEGLSPVRLELGPGKDRDKVRMNMKNPSQVRDNHLLGTRKGRGHGQGTGQGHPFEHRRHGSRREKGRHGKGELSADLDLHRDFFSSQLLDGFLVLDKQHGAVDGLSLLAVYCVSCVGGAVV